MPKKPWTPEREAAVLAKAERGLDVSELAPAVANPLRKPGRPSLSPEGGTSKALNARIPSDLHGLVVAFARKTGRSVSDLTRDALSALLDAAGAESPDAAAPRATKAMPGRASRSPAVKNVTVRRAKAVKAVGSPPAAKSRKARTTHG